MTGARSRRHRAPGPYGRLSRAVELLARTTAIVGGLVLLALVLLTCASVLGRGLDTFAHSELLDGIAPGVARALRDAGLGPILGDFELVEAGIAFAIFCFLPICQLHRSHASVDVFTGFLPSAAQRAIVAFWELVLGLAIALIAWRLYAGLEGKVRNGETTFLLQFPVWWAYAASFAAACVSCVIALYCAVERLGGVGRGGAAG